MQFTTKNFGITEIKEEEIIIFNSGIPGFEEYKRYVEIENSDAENPLHWLQCVDNGDLAFVVLDPFLVIPDYEFRLNSETINELNIEGPENVKVLCIVVVREKLEDMTINLKAPVIINVKNNKGLQYLYDNSKYTVRHKLMEEVNRCKHGSSKDKGGE